MSDENKPYFAPPADGPMPDGEVPSWGEDAEAIARDAGFGSYGKNPAEQEGREETLVRTVEYSDGQVRTLRTLVWCLCACTFTLVCCVAYLLLRGQ